MRHGALCGLASLLAALVLVSPAGAAEKPLNLSNSDWPPYFLNDPKLADKGFARDLLDACLTEAGYSPRYRVVSIEQSYAGLRNGVVDLHIFSRRADRESFLAFGSEPLFEDSYQPIQLAGKGKLIRSLADFDGLRLGHLVGLRYTDEFLAFVHSRREAGAVVEAASNEELLQLLLDGKIDVFVNLTSTARWLARQAGATSKIVVAPYVVKSSDYFLAASKTSTRVGNPTELLGSVDGCVKAMKADGRYRTLAANYGLE